MIDIDNVINPLVNVMDASGKFVKFLSETPSDEIEDFYAQLYSDLERNLYCFLIHASICNEPTIFRFYDGYIMLTTLFGDERRFENVDDLISLYSPKS